MLIKTMLTKRIKTDHGNVNAEPAQAIGDAADAAAAESGDGAADISGPAEELRLDQTADIIDDIVSDETGKGGQK